MTPRPLDVLRGLWSSVAFRLSLNYSLLAVLTGVVLLAMFYYQTVTVLESQFSRQVTATAQRLTAHFEQGGLRGLVDEVLLELTDHVNAETEILAVVARDGTVLAGNIMQWRDIGTPDADGVIRTVKLAGREIHSYLVTRPLPDGDTLVVGQDVRELYDMTRWLNRLILAASGVTLLLTIGGVLLFRRALQKRVEIIRRTALQVGEGQLAQRVPEHQHQDEFALLTRDINHMLDRIERLMEGVRHVSDSVAHNLRTPIARILARLRTVSDDPDTLRQAVDYAIVQLEELSTMSDKLLQIAEMESGMQRKRFEKVDIAQVAADLADLYSASAEDADVRLRLNSPPHAIVQGDRDMLSGALSNLLDNALKYAGPGADIQIGVTISADGVILYVADDGPGVPADKLARIGERFYRAGRNGDGFGLGLASVLAVARLHGADIQINSGPPGFRIQLAFPPAPATHAITKR